MAHGCLAAIQRLAVDAIAKVVGVPPDQLNVMPPSPVLEMSLIARADYSPEQNPLVAWGGAFLSDAFGDLLRHHQAAANSENPTT